MGRIAEGTSTGSVETRWHYRFASFSRAFGLLREALEGDIEALSSLELEGAIQRFEFTFELGWKLLKDRLEYDGISLPSVTARVVIRAAYQARLIEDAETWMDMLADRNRTSHRYDGALVEDVVTEVQSRYLPAFAHLQAKTREQMRS